MVFPPIVFPPTVSPPIVPVGPSHISHFERLKSRHEGGVPRARRLIDQPAQLGHGLPRCGALLPLLRPHRLEILPHLLVRFDQVADGRLEDEGQLGHS
jgi:hypothetical protein